MDTLLTALTNAFAISIAFPIVFVPLLASGGVAKRRDYADIFKFTAFVFAVVFVISLLSGAVTG